MKVLTWDERVLQYVGKLQELPIDHFVVVCKMAVNLFTSEKQSRRRLTRTSSACGWSDETMENSVLAVAKVLMDAAKGDLSEWHFQQSVKGLGLPENHVDVLTSLFTEHKDSIHVSVSRPTALGVPAYHKLDWRVDLELGTRFRRHNPKPIVTLRLDTVTQTDALATHFDGQAPQIDSACMRIDYNNLKHLQHQLEAALKEVDSVHCARIQRYMH